MINYRLATEEDYKPINSFYNKVRSSNRSMKQFYWEFHDLPFGKSVYVIAEDDGKIIGTNCVIPIELIDQDQRIIRSGKSEDTLVDPDYRGKKIFQNIYAYLFEQSKKQGINIIWGFTPAKKPFRKIGFDIPFDHKQCLAVNDIGKSYTYLASLNARNKVAARLKILGLCVLSKAKQLSLFKSSKPDGFKLSNKIITTEVSEIMLSNLKLVEGAYSIHQSASFLDWRVYNNPNYIDVRNFAFSDENEKVKGVIIVNVLPKGVAYLCLSCFDSSLTDKHVVSMIKYVKGELFKSGVSLIRNWLFDHNALNERESKWFKKSSFTHLSRGSGFVWKDLGTEQVDPDSFVLSRITTQGIK